MRGRRLGRYARATGRAGWRRLARLAALVALVPLASGCGLLGGLTKRLGAPESMTVTSPGFGSEAFPPQYTCHGAGLSPPLHWSGAFSTQPKSFAIVVDDGQAPITPKIYWIVFAISPSTTDIAQNQLPTGARQALNSAGTARYDPPCPTGTEVATIRLTVYALNSPLSKLPKGAGLRDAWTSIARHVIATGRLTAKASSSQMITHSLHS